MEIKTKNQICETFHCLGAALSPTLRRDLGISQIEWMEIKTYRGKEETFSIVKGMGNKIPGDELK